VGVGIIFRSDSSGALYVRQLQHGGPAQQSGQVHVGDCIVEVNGIDVFRKPISSFTKLMLGPPGTTLQLGFKRASSQMIEKVS
jgi:C-terminal processing protease CtpA/Prc